MEFIILLRRDNQQAKKKQKKFDGGKYNEKNEVEWDIARTWAGVE